jgi:cell division protein FtsI/penicillin-binding protein 2
VAHSANTGIIEIAERIPPDQLYRSFASFGFGRRSGIDYPAEARGIVPEVPTWSRLSRAGFALGQELTVTPLQVALAYAAIANGGWLPEPRLVNGPTSEDCSASSSEPSLVRVLDGRLADRLTSMLESVIVEGTGEEARIPGYRVAGKTGTAQRAVNGGFDDENHVAWFAGFFPLPDPRLVIVVAVENPRADFWGSTAAAPVFARIGEAAAGHLDLPRAGDQSLVRAAHAAASARTGGGV